MRNPPTRRTPTARQRTLLLYAVQHGRVAYIWHGRPPVDVARLQRWGWVDETGVITDAGRAAVNT